jgi:hypothetical protein
VVTRAGSNRKQTGVALEIPIIDIRVGVPSLEACSTSRHSSAACFMRAI